MKVTFEGNFITHFFPLVSYYTPWKYQIIKGFPMFSASIERETSSMESVKRDKLVMKSFYISVKNENSHGTVMDWIVEILILRKIIKLNIDFYLSFMPNFV